MPAETSQVSGNIKGIRDTHMTLSQTIKTYSLPILIE